MRTGSLRISRGHEHVLPEPRIRLVEPEATLVEPPASLDYQLIHDRLSALERLTRLHEQGTLSAAEFAFEKAAILRLPAEELVLRPEAEAASASPRKGPSLVGRLLGWRSLATGVAAGVALSVYVQPGGTMALLQQVARTMGA